MSAEISETARIVRGPVKRRVAPHHTGEDCRMRNRRGTETRDEWNKSAKVCSLRRNDAAPHGCGPQDERGRPHRNAETEPNGAESVGATKRRRFINAPATYRVEKCGGGKPAEDATPTEPEEPGGWLPRKKHADTERTSTRPNEIANA